jgi:Lon protease-like protein
MIELPLFPLNTVLFPGMPLNLHIFEERYKRMVNACLETRKPFGVVLIKKGSEALGPLADPHRIGTTARILRVERLPDGRMNILTVGEERFAIVSLGEHPDDYLVGDVEFLPSQEDDVTALAPATDALRPWVRAYINILTRAQLIQADMSHLPVEPLELAYLAAYLLQTDPREKQTLLETDTAFDLVGETLKLYKKEVILLKSLVNAPKAKEGPEGRLN